MHGPAWLGPRGGGERHLFLVGCDIFGVLLKMEKVILALKVLPPLPPGRPQNLSGKGKPPGGVGWGLKQGLLWLPEDELVM